MLASRVELGPACFVRERHREQAALERRADNDHTARRFEVLARFLFGVCLASLGEPNQPKRGASRMAGDAPRMPGALFGQEWLDRRLERVEIEPRGWLEEQRQKVNQPHGAVV